MDSRKLSVVVPFLAFANVLMFANAGNFYQDMDILYGDWRAQILEGGQLVTLTMDKASGAGIKSKNEYLFGRFDMRPHHNEIDFEFLVNQSGSPYTLHTNIYLHGKGGKEQDFNLGFFPTKDFHLYAIVWNPQRIIFLVDNVPIRVYTNWGVKGIHFPKAQPMRTYATLWNADDWATQGGRVKTDWSQAPFVASYRSYNADA
ncbi:hypothetical protein CDL15_Pgr001422 [Punica granatum]|uniref:GH16 domain-containing protein n=1 Tax=Punica granatum TaxID=22663 RepID=A0A218WLC8_PUNGR|nr:hypothetical protein CDL15_Pgr001422 [Punica granatum]